MPEETQPEETQKNFSHLGLAEPILKAIDKVGYEAPSPIQAEAIPPLLAGRDLLGQAQTGTGKTAAFALPLLSKLDLANRAPQILVLTPTRELAIQVAEAMQTYARFLKGFHVVPVYGGQSIDTQLRQLRRGVHVVVGTPGRIQDHLRRRTLQLEGLNAVVLDEADEMLRMGFIDDVEAILKHTPAEKQVALFSATMPAAIQRVTRKYLREPAEIRIKAKTATVDTVEQCYWRVAGANKLDALTRILEVEEFDAMLVFVRTKVVTAELADRLEARGFACAPLNGDMNQTLRERTVERLKAGKLDIVVATDVAARGLDVDRISHVVNFDIPYDVEAYVHRIGRTARAGRKGKAILFVSPRERRMLFAIERVTRQTIAPMQLPTRQDISDRRIEQFKQTITEALDARRLEDFQALIESYQEEHGTDLSKIAAALAFLVQRERPLLPPGRATDRQDGTRQGGHRQPGFDPSEAARPSSRRAATDRSSGSTAKRRRLDSESSDIGLQRYRIEVGRAHGVQPGNIVGAISNEGEIEGKYIGHIRIFEDFSFVDLPEGMPEDIFQHLKTVRVCGQELRLTVALGLKSKPGSDTPATRMAGSHKTTTHEPGSRKPGLAKPGAAKPRAGKPRAGKPRAAKPGSGKPGPRKSGARNTEPSEEGRSPRFRSAGKGKKGPAGEKKKEFKKPRHKKLGKKKRAKLLAKKKNRG